MLGILNMQTQTSWIQSLPNERWNYEKLMHMLGIFDTHTFINGDFEDKVLDYMFNSSYLTGVSLNLWKFEGNIFDNTFENDFISLSFRVSTIGFSLSSLSLNLSSYIFDFNKIRNFMPQIVACALIKSVFAATI